PDQDAGRVEGERRGVEVAVDVVGADQVAGDDVPVEVLAWRVHVHGDPGQGVPARVVAHNRVVVDGASRERRGHQDPGALPAQAVARRHVMPSPKAFSTVRPLMVEPEASTRTPLYWPVTESDNPAAS